MSTTTNTAPATTTTEQDLPAATPAATKKAPAKKPAAKATTEKAANTESVTTAATPSSKLKWTLDGERDAKGAVAQHAVSADGATYVIAPDGDTEANGSPHTRPRVARQPCWPRPSGTPRVTTPALSTTARRPSSTLENPLASCLGVTPSAGWWF